MCHHCPSLFGNLFVTVRFISFFLGFEMGSWAGCLAHHKLGSSPIFSLTAHICLKTDAVRKRGKNTVLFEFTDQEVEKIVFFLARNCTS